MGIKDGEEEDGDIDMTNGPGAGGSPSGANGKDTGKGCEEGGQEGKGDQGVGASKHDDEGEEGKKRGEAAEGNNGKA